MSAHRRLHATAEVAVCGWRPGHGPGEFQRRVLKIPQAAVPCTKCADIRLDARELRKAVIAASPSFQRIPRTNHERLP